MISSQVVLTQVAAKWFERDLELFKSAMLPLNGGLLKRSFPLLLRCKPIRSGGYHLQTFLTKFAGVTNQARDTKCATASYFHQRRETIF